MVSLLFTAIGPPRGMQMFVGHLLFRTGTGFDLHLYIQLHSCKHAKIPCLLAQIYTLRSTGTLRHTHSPYTCCCPAARSLFIRMTSSSHSCSFSFVGAEDVQTGAEVVTTAASGPWPCPCCSSSSSSLLPSSTSLRPILEDDACEAETSGYEPATKYAEPIVNMSDSRNLLKRSAEQASQDISRRRAYEVAMTQICSESLRVI